MSVKTTNRYECDVKACEVSSLSPAGWVLIAWGDGGEHKTTQSVLCPDHAKLLRKLMPPIVRCYCGKIDCPTEGTL